VTKSIVSLIAACLFLTGCGSGYQPTTVSAASNVADAHQWKGAPYHLAFGAPEAAPRSAGITLPPIQYTANPDMLESRADLVVHFDTPAHQPKGAVVDQMIMGPADISGRYGELPAEYVANASRQLSEVLGSYCTSGKVNISVAITKSSLSLGATEDQINAKRLSDWVPAELEFKNPNPKC